ncbi:MAG: hypothetical protein J5965_18040 [Aeriscardovia sp.]|nr:hypothetical protein [Aeriscardovia sp.]
MENKSRRDKTFALVKSIFKAEKDIRMAVIEAKTRESEDYGGGGGTSYKSDPTAGKAVRQLEPVPVVHLLNGWTVYKPELWLKVIGLTYKTVESRDSEIMREYYSGKSLAAMVGDCGYEISTLYSMRKNFLQTAVAIACQFSLVKVVDA